MTEEKKPRGRPPKVVSGIPDTFENVVKALVRPTRQEARTKAAKEPKDKKRG